MVWVGNGDECERTVHATFFDECGHIGDSSLVRYPLGPVAQTAKPVNRGGPIGIGVWPRPDTVIVAVTEEATPQGGDGVIMQPDVVAGDGTSGEATQDDAGFITAVSLADIPDRGQAILFCCLQIPPPIEAISVRAVCGNIDEWKTHPEESGPTTETIPKHARRRGAIRHVTEVIPKSSVAREFNEHRIRASGSPVIWQIQEVMNVSLPPFVRDGFDSLSRRRIALGDRRDPEIACYVVNVFTTDLGRSSGHQGDR